MAGPSTQSMTSSGWPVPDSPAAEGNPVGRGSGEDRGGEDDDQQHHRDDHRRQTDAVPPGRTRAAWSAGRRWPAAAAVDARRPSARNSTAAMQNARATQPAIATTHQVRSTIGSAPRRTRSPLRCPPAEAALNWASSSCAKSGAARREFTLGDLLHLHVLGANTGSLVQESAQRGAHRGTGGRRGEITGAIVHADLMNRPARSDAGPGHRAAPPTTGRSRNRRAGMVSAKTPAYQTMRTTSSSTATHSHHDE